MKQRRHFAHQGRNIEEKALGRRCMAQDFKIAQDFIRIVSSFIVLLKNSVLAQRPSTLVLMMINSCSYMY